MFFSAELAWTVVAMGLAWGCVKSYGLNGAGIAFFGSYVFHCFLIYPIVHHFSGFQWSKANKNSLLLFLSLIALVFYSFYVLPPFFAAGIGTIVLVISSIYSARTLLQLVSFEQLPRPIRRLIVNCKFMSLNTLNDVV